MDKTNKEIEFDVGIDVNELDQEWVGQPRLR